jgi:hypothetical protein
MPARAPERPLTELVGVLEWSEFLKRFDWRQGEHVTLIGPTGTGKTTLSAQLLYRRAFVVGVGTKPRDETFQHLINVERYQVVQHLPLAPPKTGARVIIWPKQTTLDRAAKRAIGERIRETFDRAYSAGSWCVFMDEIAYGSKTLQLRPEMEDLWQQGRAVGVSFIGSTQRPRHIPVDAYSAATHLFLWRTNDAYDLKRLGELNNADVDLVRRVVKNLPAHHALYVSTRTGAMAVTLAPRL